jgi:hypothetical protein
LRDSNKRDYYEDLLQSVDEFFGMGEKSRPLGEWAETLPVILDGKPFSFHQHEYLREPYDDPHPYQVFLKAAQLGCTSLAILKALYRARFKNYRGILYLFPNRSDVLDFSKGRVTPLLEDNPETLAKWIRDTDSAGMKQIWNAFLYLRGMRSRAGLKSVPIDLTIMDEVDEAPQYAVDMAMERMSHSLFKEVLMLSNPTLPDYGIDRKFQETDQRYWLLKCEKCGEHTCLEDEFPDCLLEVNGRVIRACKKCKAELNPSVGEWVAKCPDILDKRGYHFSQLFSYFVDPKDILHQFRTTNNLTDFWNLKIGIPFVEAENRLSTNEVFDLCGAEGILSSDFGPCFMGVDQGKDLHVVIGKRHTGKAGRIIHLGIYRDWEDLDHLMKSFNVIRCVVDGQPEQRNARAFAERHRGRIFLSFYQEHQKGNYLWDEKNLTVSANRTEALDASHHEISSGNIIIPHNQKIVGEFAHHCHNVAKKLEENEETGSRRYVYIKLGPDHFRHAYSYEAMARQYASHSFFGDVA